MGQVTVEEPKTVVDEVTRYECDKCGYVGEEDGMNQFKIFSDTNVHKKSGHLCDECAEKERYVTFMDLQRDKQRIGEAISWVFNRFDFLLGAAISTALYFSYQFVTSVPDSYSRVITEWSIADTLMFFLLSSLVALASLLFMVLLSLYFGVDPEQ